jgi:hypothetical protein
MVDLRPAVIFNMPLLVLLHFRVWFPTAMSHPQNYDVWTLWTPNYYGVLHVLSYQSQ